MKEIDKLQKVAQELGVKIESQGGKGTPTYKVTAGTLVFTFRNRRYMEIRATIRGVPVNVNQYDLRLNRSDPNTSIIHEILRVTANRTELLAKAVKAMAQQISRAEEHLVDLSVKYKRATGALADEQRENAL